MEKLFDEANYREYLENKYVYEADKHKSRKEYIDKYSKEDLQQIIDDTKIFIEAMTEELKKEENSLINDSFFEIKLEDDYNISTNLIGGWPADTIYKVHIGNDLYISRHLVEEYFGHSLNITEDEIESYNEEEQVGSTISIPYLFMTVPKKEVKELTEKHIKK